MAIISLENILKHFHSFALHNETEKKWEVSNHSKSKLNTICIYSKVNITFVIIWSVF